MTTDAIASARGPRVRPTRRLSLSIFQRYPPHGSLTSLAGFATAFGGEANQLGRFVLQQPFIGGLSFSGVAGSGQLLGASHRGIGEHGDQGGAWRGGRQ